MKTNHRRPGLALAAAGTCILLAAGVLWVVAGPRQLTAGPHWPFGKHHSDGGDHSAFCTDISPLEEGAGAWYWMRSPEQEKRVIASLFNRYCIRCHGVDGRGVWDIPDVPDFTDARWQASRSDGQIARIILEGRGAVMPPFRGTLTLEEAWAMARYLRTLPPGTQASRPDRGPAKKRATPAK
jgi:hypothetical protein